MARPMAMAMSGPVRSQDEVVTALTNKFTFINSSFMKLTIYLFLFPFSFFFKCQLYLLDY